MCPIALQIEADVVVESDPRMSASSRPAPATTVGKCGGRLLAEQPPATHRPSTRSLAADLVGSDQVVVTSVIPHVLVPHLAEACRRAQARRALVLNLVGRAWRDRRVSPRTPHPRLGQQRTDSNRDTT